MPNLITNPNDIYLNERQELIQFIGRPPSVLLHFGITAIACVVAMLIAMSYFIKYPDTVVAKVVLTTENPPIRVLTKASGRVSAILIQNNEIVQTGQILAVMENTADWRDVLTLEKNLEKNNPLPAYIGISYFNSISTPRLLHLGALQNNYSTFTQNLKDYRYFLEKNGVLNKIRYINKQIESIKALNVNLLKQKDIQIKEFEFTEKDLTRQKTLHTEGVISDLEFEKNNTQYLQQKRQIEANEVAFINNQMQIQQHEAQINDLLQTKSDSKNNKELTIIEDIRRLKAAIEEWKQTFLIIAPISGSISLAKVWSPQQSLASGEEFATVVPSALSTKPVAKAVLPAQNSAKVKLGLTANIHLDAYPYQQYGILKGTVKNVSLVPQQGKEDDNYLLEIELNDSLTTSYNKKLTFKQEMQGSANIITEDRRVVDRLLDRFRDLIKNK